MSKASEARWLAEYRQAGSLYTLAECGCLMWVLVDMPVEVRHAAKDIAEQIAKGRTIQRCGRTELPPLNCPTHEAERQRVHEAAQTSDGAPRCRACGLESWASRHLDPANVENGHEYLA
jgi:hypothetical protein